MIVHRMMFVLLLGLGAGFGGVVSAEEYRDAQRHFTLQLPAGWGAITPDMIQNLNAVVRQRMPGSNVEYFTGFQRKDRGPMQYPYVLLQTIKLPGNNVTYEDLENNLAKEFKAGVKKAEGAFSDVGKGFDVGTPILDRAHNRLVIRIEMEVLGVGKVKGVSVGFLGSKELNLVHCYTVGTEFDRTMLATFEPLLNSFRYDEGYAFAPAKSSIGGDMGSSAFRGAIIGGIVGALVCIPVYLYRRFQKPKEPTPAA